MSDPTLPYGGRRHRSPVPGEDALAATDLEVCYPESKVLALKGVNLRVPVASRVALVGPNGAGKSTLLKCAAGLLPCRSGALRIYGNPPGACHHRVAYLEQRGEVDWNFPITVWRMVMGGRYVHLGWIRRPGSLDREVVEAELNRLGLADLAERQVRELSGGQQQRLLLARALVQQADLLLFDEPLNAVDTATRQVVMRVLDQLKKDGKTVLMATHDYDRDGALYDAAIFLDQGRVCQDRSDSMVLSEEVTPG